MNTVILVIHLMIVTALIGTVLLQRSEGGGLGIGGGGGGGGFLGGRGSANVLTRATAILAAAFFATSIILTILANQSPAGRSILDKLQKAPVAPVSDSATPALPAAPADGAAAPIPAKPTVPAAGGGLLDKLKGNDAPATP